MLSGRRLILRPLHESDAPELHRWFNDPRVLEELGARHVFFCVSMEEEKRIVRGMLEDRERKAFMIVEREAARPVGMAS